MHADLHAAASARRSALLREADAERLARQLRRSRGAGLLRNAAGRALVGLGEQLMSDQHRAPQHRGAG